MKLTKEYIRTVIREEVSNVLESQANPQAAEAAIKAIDAAPSLSQALDKVQDSATGGLVLTHFVNKLAAKGMDKSKLVRMMTDQFNAAKTADTSTVGKSSASKTTMAPPAAAPAK